MLLYILQKFVKLMAYGEYQSWALTLIGSMSS